MKIVIHQDAEEEAFKASSWYASHEPHLRSQFEFELHIAMDEILENPYRFSKLEYYLGRYEIRRKKLGVFSYVAIYVILDDLINIISISHTSREPLYWIDRLKNLS